MKSRIWPYVENVTEAGCACLITMVQGNLLALGVAHWIIASQTGLVAGAIAGTTIVAAKLRKQWVISLMLGVVTATVDFYVHPGMFGAIAIAEAMVTGVGAASLSYLASLLFMLRRSPAR
ncbi:MAG: hypothetical protein HKN13_04085 [Rhodothermales bacterium]|nr:hypothetical protein [Rhodothermales bacterium]